MNENLSVLDFKFPKMIGMNWYNFAIVNSISSENFKCDSRSLWKIAYREARVKSRKSKVFRNDLMIFRGFDKNCKKEDNKMLKIGDICKISSNLFNNLFDYNCCTPLQQVSQKDYILHSGPGAKLFVPNSKPKHHKSATISDIVPGAKKTNGLVRIEIPEPKKKYLLTIGPKNQENSNELKVSVGENGIDNSSKFIIIRQ